MTTWMVVEDEPDVYELLLALFDLWGIEGVAFITRDEAIAWINDVDNGRYQGELPDMALLDIRLPDDMYFGGVVVAERLRKSPVLGSIAITYVTAGEFSPEERRNIYARTSPDEWIKKPLPTFDKLRVILDDVLAKKGIQTSDTSQSSSENGKVDDAELMDDDFVGVDDDWTPADTPLPTFDGLDDQTDHSPSPLSTERHKKNKKSSSQSNNHNNGEKSDEKPRNDSSQ